MSRQPEPSGPHGLPMASLPLTQTQRNELDQTIHGALGRFILDSIEDPEIADMNLNAELIMVLRCVLFETSRVLKHNELVNVLEPPDFAKDIVERHPQLREMIRQACQTKSFSPIIDLKILQTDTSPPVRSELAQDDDELDRLHDSFKTPYIGKAVDGFYEYLKNNNNKFRGKGISRPYYAKFCSIVQSSGTGKSRLITELRTKGVLVLYMNLREPNDSGFPVRDPVPARILTEDMDCTQAEYTARCCVLFTAIFQTLQQNLSSRLPTLRSANADATIKAWNDEMCNMQSNVRKDFFAEVESLYRVTFAKINIPIKSAEPATAGGTFSGSKLEGESYLKRAFNEMVAVLPHISTAGKGGETGKRKREEKRKDKALDDEPKLVIAFDEAHPLGKISSKNFRPSHILGRTINSYSRNTDAPVWVVFASTTSHVADFSVPQVIHDSLRVAIAGELLYPPYTDLGWDQHAVPLAGVAANDVATFLHVVGFGRPLWKTYVQNEIADGIMMLAAQKLCKSKTFDPTVPDQALALLSQRFCLDICFGHPDAVSHIETGVASHLRICFSTTQDRIWSFTGYPSEPFLSCVAAISLHADKINLTLALDVLKDKIDGGMVEIGQSGELTSRLLLLLAKDLFIRMNPSEGVIQDLHNKGGNAELIDCQKVSVIEFLKYLFGPTFWSEVKEAEADFQHAHINFSHWVSMTEFISPPRDPERILAEQSRCTAEEWTLRHWHRTSAVQCCHLQPLVDKMIPIYFDDPALASDLKRVSQILISDKAGKSRHVRDLNYITRTHHSIQCSSERPYIALLLDLNVTPELTVTYPEKVSTRTETGRCLQIYASGMSDITFSFLRDHHTLATQLEGFVSRQKEDPPQTTLQALVKFGSTARLHNMQWERN